MSLPVVIRVFFAIDLPAQVKKKLGQFIHTLKKQSPAKLVRWTKPENLHVTLQFLADIRSADIPPLLQHVRQHLAKAAKPLSFSVGNMHLFPHPFRPRVIVLDIDPQAELASLANLIGRGIQDTHYEIEKRPFRAHLTLGRIKHSQATNLGFLASFPLPQLDKIEVDEAVLFRSEPTPAGSKYTPLEKICLIGKERKYG